MLYHPKTKVNATMERLLHSTAGNVYEGQALITKMELAVGRVLPSGGNSGEVFAGFAMNYNKVPATAKMTELVTVPASPGPYTVTLKRTPLTPSTASSAVTATGTALTYDAGGGLASGEYAISGAVITFHSAQAGNSYYVTYSYTLTVDEAVALHGDGNVIGNREASDITKSIGVIRSGFVYTDQFDALVNWFAADIADIKCGAAGVITRGGNGAALTNAVVVEAPTVDVPYLGIYLW